MHIKKPNGVTVDEVISPAFQVSLSLEAKEIEENSVYLKIEIDVTGL